MLFGILGPLRAAYFLSIKRKASEMRPGSIRQDSGSPEAIRRDVSEVFDDARHSERTCSLSLHRSDKASGYAPGNAAPEEMRL